MGAAAPRPCRYPACGALVYNAERAGYCERHQSAVRREVDRNRDTEARKLYTYRWRMTAKAFLVRHPICECKDCQQVGRVLASTVVDHVVPHRGDRALFWDRNNWQAMSKPCHDRKTATEDGGFGR